MNLLKLLLFSLCINYPIIYNWGYGCKAVVALLFEDAKDIKGFICDLGFQPVIDNGSLKYKDFRRKTINANSDGIFLILPNSKSLSGLKLQEKIDFVKLISITGEVEGRELGGPCFMCFTGLIPDEMESELFIIRETSKFNADELLENEGIDLMSLIPRADQLELVRDKLSCLMKTAQGINGNEWLYAAGAFLYPGLMENDGEEVYERLLETIPFIIKSAESMKGSDSVICACNDIFLDLARWGEFDDSIKVQDLHCIEVTKDKEWFENKYFVRGADLFLSDTKLKFILDSVINDVPVDIVKRRLAQAGIIDADGSSYATKMYFKSLDACPYYPRMIRIHTELVSDGDESLKDILSLRLI